MKAATTMIITTTIMKAEATIKITMIARVMIRIARIATIMKAAAIIAAATLIVTIAIIMKIATTSATAASSSFLL